MNVLTIILLIVVVIMAVPVIGALFFSTQFEIVAQTIINKPRQLVFDYIKLSRNQDNYSKWVMADPGMKKTFTGTDGTPGFIYAWDSENKQAGKGEQEIKTLKEGEHIENEVRFERPFTGKALTILLTEPIADNQTKVTWVFKGERTFVMKMMYFLLNLKNALKKDMETSLHILKTILEK